MIAGGGGVYIGTMKERGNYPPCGKHHNGNFVVSIFKVCVYNKGMSDVTRILAAIEQGDVQAVDKLFPLVYQELRRLAAQ